MKSKITFVILRGKDRQFYFRIVARNGKTIAQSEGYRRRSSARATINTICEAARISSVLITDDT